MTLLKDSIFAAHVFSLILSLCGLIIAAYFTLAFYGRVRKSRWVPEILCARQGSSCVTVLQTPYARIFGLPNSLLGMVFYAAVAAWAMAGQTPDLRGVTWALVAASAITVALGFYLIYALRRILHTGCPLCYAAHAINGALLVLLALSASGRLA